MVCAAQAYPTHYDTVQNQTYRSAQYSVLHSETSIGCSTTTSIKSHHTIPYPVDLPQPYHAALYYPLKPPTSTMYNTIQCRLPSDQLSPYHTTALTSNHTKPHHLRRTKSPQAHHSPCTSHHALARPHSEVTSAIHRQKHKPGVSQLCKI